MSQLRRFSLYILFFILASVFSAGECRAIPFSYLAFDNLNQVTQRLTVRAIAQDETKVIWLATESGLYSYDGYLLRSHNLLLNLPSRPNGQFQPGSLNCILADGDSLLIGCNVGILSFHLSDHSTHYLGYARTETINSIYRHQDQLWVVSETSVYCNEQRMPQHFGSITGSGMGTTGLFLGTNEGSFRITFNDFHLERLQAPIKKPKCFLSVYQNGMLWIGNEDKVILWDDSNQNIQFEASVPVAKKISSDRQGNILISTDNGLYFITPRRDISVARHDARSLTSLSGDIVWDLFADSDNNLWIGTNSGISYVCYRPRLLCLPLPVITGEGQGNQIQCMIFDSKGRFWFGGTTGLICIDDYRHNFRQYRWYRMDDEQYPIHHNRIRCIVEDSQGRIWVGGDGGMMCYNEQTQQFTRLLIAEDDNNWVYDIQEADAGSMQVTTYNASYLGVPDVERRCFNVSIQFERLGLNLNSQRGRLEQLSLADQFNCYWYDSLTNRYFLGGLDELALFDPKRHSAEHSLRLTDIRIDDSRYVTHGEINSGVVTLGPSDHVVEFFFSDFDYADQFSGNFLYRLGNEGAWYPIRRNDRSLVLNNLSPGTYDLYIRHVETAESEVNQLAPLVHFRVRPPWYKTLQAQLIFLLLILILFWCILTFIRQHRHQLLEHRHRASQLLLARKKENELKSSNEYLENQLRARMREELGDSEDMNSDDRFLSDITSIIQDHLDDAELNVQRLSQLSNVSTKQLYRRVKQLTGMTTVAYIRDLRLKRAAILLADQKYTVSEVMYRVGFTCPSYFARCFFDTYGKSPSEFANSPTPQNTVLQGSSEYDSVSESSDSM